MRERLAIGRRWVEGSEITPAKHRAARHTQTCPKPTVSKAISGWQLAVGWVEGSSTSSVNHMAALHSQTCPEPTVSKAISHRAKQPASWLGLEMDIGSGCFTSYAE